jgi:Fe-S cluster assembly ATPase SufC
MKTKGCFRHIGILSNEAAGIIGVLELGFTGEHCSRVAVQTSPRGMSILLDGRVLCKGGTARECLQRLEELKAAAADAKLP